MSVIYNSLNLYELNTLRVSDKPYISVYLSIPFVSLCQHQTLNYSQLPLACSPDSYCWLALLLPLLLCHYYF